MNPRPSKKPEDRKDYAIRLRVTKEALDEISRMAAIHGFSDNRSKFIELAARGLLVVDRSKLETDTALM